MGADKHCQELLTQQCEGILSLLPATTLANGIRRKNKLNSTPSYGHLSVRSHLPKLLRYLSKLLPLALARSELWRRASQLYGAGPDDAILERVFDVPVPFLQKVKS